MHASSRWSFLASIRNFIYSSPNEGPNCHQTFLKWINCGFFNFYLTYFSPFVFSTRSLAIVRKGTLVNTRKAILRLPVLSTGSNIDYSGLSIVFLIPLSIAINSLSHILAFLIMLVCRSNLVYCVWRSFLLLWLQSNPVHAAAHSTSHHAACSAVHLKKTVFASRRGT